MQAGFKWKRFARPELDTLPKTFRLSQKHHNINEAVDRYKLLSSAHIINSSVRRRPTLSAIETTSAN